MALCSATWRPSREASDLLVLGSSAVHGCIRFSGSRSNRSARTPSDMPPDQMFANPRSHRHLSDARIRRTAGNDWAARRGRCPGLPSTATIARSGFQQQSEWVAWTQVEAPLGLGGAVAFLIFLIGTVLGWFVHPEASSGGDCRRGARVSHHLLRHWLRIVGFLVVSPLETIVLLLGTPLAAAWPFASPDGGIAANNPRLSAGPSSVFRCRSIAARHSGPSLARQRLCRQSSGSRLRYLHPSQPSQEFGGLSDARLVLAA